MQKTPPGKDPMMGGKGFAGGGGPYKGFPDQKGFPQGKF